ncbi:MAG: hypothetical protein HY696_06075 [Deltaproteobacteria bacterium]|nr:hypothetical protein [Deltaproteobacteria bacterium]
MFWKNIRPLCSLLVACCWIGTAASQEPPPLSLEDTAAALQRQLLGANAATEAIPLRLRATFALPTVPAFPALRVSGRGTIPYQLQADQILLRNSDLPRLRGTLQGPDIPGGPYKLSFNGHAGSRSTITWDPDAIAITLHGLQLDAKVFAANGTAPLLRFALPPIRLTTGTIQIASAAGGPASGGGKPVTGILQLKERRATLVGTFRMPKTGLPPLDAKLHGQTVLLTLQGQVVE